MTAAGDKYAGPLGQSLTGTHQDGAKHNVSTRLRLEHPLALQQLKAYLGMHVVILGAVLLAVGLLLYLNSRRHCL